MFHKVSKSFCIWALILSTLVVLSVEQGYANQLNDGIEEPVYFKDSRLKAAIEKTLTITDPTPTDMLDLKNLSVFSELINSLVGLEYAINLQNLNASYNEITDITALTELTDLTELDLSSNCISDISVLSNLTALTHLSLSSNNIKSIAELKSLVKMTHLYLGGNQIEDVSALIGLTGLKELHLFSNEIVDVSALEKLTELMILYLEYNNINEISCLAGISKLERLHINNNEIKTISALENLPNLIEFWFENNPIESRQDAIQFEDAALKAAVEQSLHVSIPALKDMHKLQYLSAYDKGIYSLKGLEYATELHRLGLGENQIIDISPLANLNRLQDVNLNDNNITDISALANKNNLRYLKLSNNYIADISALAGLTNLTELSLSYNQITGISALAGLTNLTGLSLSGNAISDISELTGLRKMRFVELESNELASISALRYMPELISIILRDNNITDISPLANLTKLEYLDLANNEISNITGLENLTKLRWLYLDDNKITSIPSLRKLTHLEFMHLHGNEIRDISFLENMTSLRELRLDNNEIRAISGLEQLTELTILNLSQNQIVDIAVLEKLTQLTNLDLSGNKIENVSALSNLVNLVSLQLRNNRLKSEDSNAILEIHYNCPLVRISSDLVHPVPDSRVLYVDDDAALNGDGSSWSKAFKHLQDAIAAARYGDEIRVAQGVYKPDQGNNLIMLNPFTTATFQLKNNIAIKGGYSGVSSFNPDMRDFNEYITLLQGDLAENDIDDCSKSSYFDNSNSVVTADHTGSGTLLDGFVISGGRGPDGAGIRAIDGHPTVKNCVLQDNSAGLRGGGIFYQSLNRDSNDCLCVINCSFIRNFAGDSGGAVYVWKEGPSNYLNPVRVELQDCRFIDNTESYSAIMGNDSVKLSNCVFTGLALGSAIQIQGNRNSNKTNVDHVINNLTITGQCLNDLDSCAGQIQDADIHLEGDLHIEDGTLSVCNTLFDGPGSINLAKDTMLRITNVKIISPDYKIRLNSLPTILHSKIYGTGTIQIDANQQLIVEEDAILNLNNSLGDIDDRNLNGHIIIEGSLVIRDNATLENCNIEVRLLEILNSNTIQYNNLILLEASTGFGGEFFVAGNARIKNNYIVSEGDRYLDMDPDPQLEHKPTISQNRITVIIKEGALSNQGTLLELRAKDYDGIGTSGAHPVSEDSLGFTDDPSENWVLEKLILEPDSKLNLTNRQGFEFQDLTEPYPETVYVKELVMGPNSVLNTAFQTLYYQDLVLTDANGLELARNPSHEDIMLINGAEITDIPLLGFSLGIIAMNDQAPSPHNEFDVRVRRRLIDPNDEQPDPNNPSKIGSIELLRDDPAIPPGYGGVMEMRTQAPGKQSASSIAAKGAFSRAGDEDITVEFEYLFLDDPYGQAELIIYLSDHPEVSQDYREPYEIARIYPPATGRPGSVESNEFAFFSGTFLRKDLNFTRGTYVELELRGAGVSCWIDNWDPQVSCTEKCGDFDKRGFPEGIPGINVYDYLVMLAEFGLSEPRNRCLDFIPDGCVNSDDLTAWEFREALNRCPSDPEQPVSSTETLSIKSMFSRFSDVTESAQDSPLLIAGKPNTFKGVSSIPDTHLYSVSTDGFCTGPGTEITPISSNTVSGYGRLVTDDRRNVYQVHGERGLICPDTGDVVIASGRKNREKHPESAVFSQEEINSVLVGLDNGEGLPLLDVAFDHFETDIVYVVPVQVNNSYAAAAKLRLNKDGDTYTGDYDIIALYSETSSNVVTNPENTEHIVSEPDYQHLHEIEVDVDGIVYVLSSHTGHSASQLVGNNWLLVFDKQGGMYREPVDLHKMGLVGPTAMVVSSFNTQKTMYFASSIVGQGDHDQLTTQIYSLALTDIDHLGSDELTLGVIEIDCPPPIFCNMYPHLYDPNEGCVAAITSISAHPSNGDLYVTGFVAPRFSLSYTFPVDQIVEFFTSPILATISSDAETEGAKIIEGADLALPLSVAWIEPEERSTGGNNTIPRSNDRLPFDYLRSLTQLWLRRDNTYLISGL